MGAPVVHWEINTKDSTAVKNFYSALFGWQIDSNNTMNYGLVSTGNKKGIGGGISQADPNMPFPAVTFYVEVDDPQSYLNKAEGLGGRTIVPVTEIPQMVTFALFMDPDGNKIGLVKSTGMVRKPARRKKAARKPARSKSRTARRRRK